MEIVDRIKEIALQYDAKVDVSDEGEIWLWARDTDSYAETIVINKTKDGYMVYSVGQDGGPSRRNIEPIVIEAISEHLLNYNHYIATEIRPLSL